MTTSTAENAARATRVVVTDDAIVVDLSDGRTITAPIAWYPRIQHGTADERNQFRLLGGGAGIHWPKLDEDISVANLIAGAPSAESQQSFKRWLSERKSG